MFFSKSLNSKLSRPHKNSTCRSVSRVYNILFYVRRLNPLLGEPQEQYEVELNEEGVIIGLVNIVSIILRDSNMWAD
jgi:hypothetical protein